jgi:TPR repeat protein/serine/threonine protein kinase
LALRLLTLQAREERDMTKPKPGTVYDQHSRGRTASVSVGDVIGGHYLIEEVLDEGGMAMVYRATNSATQKPCALKILHAHFGDREEFLHLFSKEAKVSSVIGDSAHIVSVFDAGLDEELGVPFIVMELLEGQTLERVLEQGPLSPRLARHLLVQLADALEQAHSAGVVHRDLKPSNLFVTTDKAGEPLLKVMDFGIAKVLEGEAVRTATHIGTPAYNAPEQMGSSTRKLAEKVGITIGSGVSPATDVWALGLIAYEMFTGDLPGKYWGVETLSELPMKVAFEELVPASERAGNNAALLPAGFDAWFARCLRKNAAERWSTAGEAIVALLELIDADGDVEDLDEAELDAVSTRLYDSPVTAPDKAKTRLRSDGKPDSQRPDSKRPDSKRLASDPPPLPRISSPAITVAAAPALGASGKRKTDDAMRGAVSSASAVVKAAKAKKREGVGSGRWPLLAGVVALVLTAGGAVGYKMVKQTGAEDACLASDSAERCEGACQAGSLASCERLAVKLERGEGTAKDELRARQLYTRACGVEPLDSEEQVRAWSVAVEAQGCEGGACVASACVALAGMHEQGRAGALGSARAATSLYKRVCRLGLDDERERGSAGCVGLGLLRERAGEIEAARNYYSAACEDGLSSGCVALGSILERGDGEWRDEKKARALYEKACEGGDLKGCTLLGTMVERGKGGWVADPAAAVAHYRRACEGTELLGCVYLAHAHQHGRGGLTRDAVRAAELLQRGCDGGEMLACAELAAMTLAGEGGLEVDEKRVFELNQRSCEAGMPRGCSQLGKMYLEGKASLTRDPVEGRSLIERGCRGGDAVGCLALGRLDAAAGKLAGAELAALYAKACEGGAAEGCVATAEMLEAGNGVDVDLVRAAELYQRACDEGALRGCTHLGNLVYQGTGGLERDPKRSVALNEQACKGGDRVGCARLGLLFALGHGVEVDLKRAAELHRSACNGEAEDEAQARRCAMLGERVAPPSDEGDKGAAKKGDAAPATP